ncbi:iron-containing alcohol dehydrogenase [Youngiibacter multivorans]|uniref:Alcohol dehydrogenase n=1 Tax=Youngiibacter multivorans TaxID=937251 RepID=A0ABS4FZ56_9CLOT|nr:iron-containing alcohol dehydrogenase [Youngiibacter multivorans]MBP1917591.1 alcohol dehydrogenase [Youngiibacter multivorans]
MAVSAYFIPTVNLIGAGTVNEVGEKIKVLGGKKVLIVTDAMLAKFGMADRVKGIIEASGLEAVIFDGAEPNPTDLNVAAGLKAWKKHKCDSLVSLGGGSSHDCAKGVGLLASNGGNIKDYEGVDVSKNEFVPYVALNTTAGTASEMTRFCIITDTSRKVKMAIIDWRVTAKVSINDPELMAGMPPSLTAATGMDALTHAVEAYVSTIANPLTDSAALMAIKLVAEYLPKAVANGTDMVSREKMAYAQFLAGMAFNNASLGYVHAMAHQLGGFYNLPHGVCNAILLPVVSQFNLLAKADRFRDIAVAMGECVDGLSVNDAGQVAIEAIKTLSKAVGIPDGLSKLNVKEVDFEVMAKNAKLDACQLTNPRLATLEQVIELFRKAM